MSATAPERVTAAALIIGDEILSGRTADVNLNAIANFLTGHGVDLAEARFVCDSARDIVEAVNALRSRYDYVITTGGIGPTHDDITADCVAEAFNLPLVEDPQIIADMTARFSEPPNEARRRMARIPEGGSKVKNALGGPPGFQIDNVFVLAGIPRVMQSMLQDVGPRLRGGAVMLSRTLKVEAAGEGLIAGPLGATAIARPDLIFGSYPFQNEKGYGANLVVRGRDPAALETGVEALLEALARAGIEGATREPD